MQIFDFDTNIEKTFASSLRNESEVEKGRKDQKDNIEIKVGCRVFLRMYS